MKSNRQRKTEIKAKRVKRAEKARRQKVSEAPRIIPGAVAVNRERLKLGYGLPDFVRRGYYLDEPFTCNGCGNEEVWSATQQKWWYEVAGGDVSSRAVKCRSCRQRESARKRAVNEARLAGLAKKAARRGRA
jgi:hypothetical protein